MSREQMATDKVVTQLELLGTPFVRLDGMDPENKAARAALWALADAAPGTYPIFYVGATRTAVKGEQVQETIDSGALKSISVILQSSKLPAEMDGPSPTPTKPPANGADRHLVADSHVESTHEPARPQPVRVPTSPRESEERASGVRFSSDVANGRAGERSPSRSASTSAPGSAPASARTGLSALFITEPDGLAVLGLLIGSTVLTALVVRKLGVIVELIGATSGTFVTFIAPGAAYVRLRGAHSEKPGSPLMRAAAVFSIFLGIVMLPVSLFVIFQ
jgi:hypothetical protein